MSVGVKICGLRDAGSIAAAVEGGAGYVGFVFYPGSPRAVDADTVAQLIQVLPETVLPVGLFVDAGDEEIAGVLRKAPLRMLQLHGAETPERVAAVRKFSGLPIIKAVGISAAKDIDAARQYEAVADMLLLDAKPQAGQLPGGNAAVFDWSLLKNAGFNKPWMLAGGLTEHNIADAVAMTGARLLDVSSGVEDVPGHKDIRKIRGFLTAAGGLETCC